MRFIKDVVCFMSRGLLFQAHANIERAMIASLLLGSLAFGFLVREDVSKEVVALLNLKVNPHEFASHLGIYCVILQFSFLWLLAKVPNDINALHEECSQITTKMSNILSKGKRGELLTHGFIELLRDRMTFIQRGQSWSPADANIKDIVLLGEDGQHSQEIDDLLVVDNHVLIFEVKDWQGKISSQDENLIVNGNIRKSPHAQTISKIQRIKLALNKADVKANIHPIYVFSHPEAELDPNLSFNFVRLDALDTFLKCLREKIGDANIDSLLASDHVYHIKNCLMRLMDKRVDAKHHHMLMLAEMPNPNKEVLAYAALNQSLVDNQTLAETLTPDYAWNFTQKWMRVLVFIVVLAIIFDIFSI